MARKVLQLLDSETVTEAIASLEATASRFLDIGELCRRPDAETDLLANTIGDALLKIVPGLRDVGLLTAGPSHAGRILGWLGPTGHALVPWDGDTTAPVTMLSVPADSPPVCIGPATAGELPFPLVPCPTPRDLAWRETPRGTFHDQAGVETSPFGFLTPGRALGRLVAWELGHDGDLADVANRLARAGLGAAGGEVLLSMLVDRAPSLDADSLELAREFFVLHGIKGHEESLDAYLLREIDAEEQRLRDAGDYQGIARALLARQQLERGQPRIRTLTRLANMLRERLGDADGASMCLVRALDEDPEDESLLHDLVEGAATSGNPGDVAARLLEMAATRTTAVRTRLARAASTLMRSLGDQAGSWKALLVAVEGSPEDRDLLDEALTTGATLGDGVVLASIWKLRRDAATGMIERRDATAGLARVLQRLGRNDEAIAAWKDVLVLDPGHREAFDALLDGTVNAGDAPGAAELCKQTADRVLDPGVRAHVLRRWGHLLADRLRDDRQAARVLAESLALDPDRREVAKDLADLQEVLGDWLPLLGTLRRMARLDPDKAHVHLIRMADVAIDHLDDPFGALGFLTEALEGHPNLAEARRRIQNLHERLGLWSDLAHDLEEQALEEGPAHLDVLVRLADLQERRLTQRDRAKDTLWRALEGATDTRAHDIAMRLAEMHHLDGDRDRELKVLNVAVQAAPDDEEAADIWARIGRRHMAPTLDRIPARNALELALRLNPSHAVAAELLASLLLEEGDCEAVLPVLDPIISRAMKAGDEKLEHRLRTIIASAAYRCRNTDEAASQYRRLLELEPDSVPTRLALGRLLAEVGQNEEALGLLEPILAGPNLHSNDRPDLVRITARCAARAGRNERALELLDDLLGMNPGRDLELLRERIEVATAANDPARLVRCLEDLALVETAGPARFQVYLRLGDLCSQSLNAPSSARHWYEKAADEGVSTKAALHKALDAAVRANEYVEAQGILGRIHDLEEDGRKQSHYHLASALIARDNMSNQTLAREHLWKAVTLDPALEDAVEALENLLVSAEDYEDLANLQQLLARHYRLGGHRDRLAAMLRRLARNYDEHLHNAIKAADSLRQILEIEPNDLDTALRLAAVLTRTPGREVEALEAHRKVAELDPTHVEAYRAIRDLCVLTGDEDGAWCAASALVAIGQATDEERGAFETRRQPTLRLRRDTLPPDAWVNSILDPAVDEGVARVFSILYKPLSRILPFKDPKEMGLTPADRVDLSGKGLFQNMSQAASRVLGIPLPVVYHARGRAGFAKVAFNPPALVVGDDVLTAWRGRELRFSLGRSLVAFAPGFELAGISDPGSLRLFFLAALRIAFPDFPLPDGEGGAAEIATDIAAGLTPAAQGELKEILTAFRKQKKAVDVHSYLAGVDRTAGRAGLLLANDLEIAGRQLGEDTVFLSDLEFGDKLVDLCAWLVSARTGELRKQMLQA
jgi:tetratricopeptide (TPR) repeat protein